MAITTFIAVSSSVLVMAAWFVLPGSARPVKTTATCEGEHELDVAA